MKKIHAETDTIILYEKGDSKLMTSAINQEPIGLFLHECHGGIEQIKQDLQKHSISYEVLDNTSVFVKEKDERKINRIQRCMTIGHGFLVVYEGFKGNYRMARWHKENSFFLDAEKTHKRFIVGFDKQTHTIRICKPKNKYEIVRLINIPVSHLKQERKEKIGDIEVIEENKTFTLIDPSHLRYSDCFMSDTHEVVLEKGNYELYTIKNIENEIVGFTIEYGENSNEK